MAFALISSVSAGSASGNAITTGSLDSSGANLIVACVAGYKGTNPVGAVSDNKSNTYNSLTAYAIAGNPDFVTFIAWSIPTTTGSGHTFTVGANSTFCSLYVASFSGCQASSPVDQTNGGNTIVSGNRIQSGSITPTTNNQLIVSSSIFLNVGTDANSVDNGFTLLLHLPTTAGQFQGGSYCYLIQSTAAAVNPGVLMNANDLAAASVASFFAATASGTVRHALPYLGVG